MDIKQQNELLNRLSSYEKFGSILGLSRIRRLTELLGNPHRDLKVIHVAGTNGKGSVCAYLDRVLSSCGYSVGLFTSPYITQWRERIKLNGEMIGWEKLKIHSERVFEAADIMAAQGESPTEFEVVTAIALSYYGEEKPDFVILEVGLGGRGDSTNVIEKPLVSVITSINKDHTDRLGDTIEEIAGEKAGIIKKGCPVVANPADETALKVIAREAYKKEAPLKDMSKVKPAVRPVEAAEDDFFRNPDNSLPTTCFSMEIEGIRYPDIEISMAGEHQVNNAVTALGAIELLRKKGIIKLDGQRLREAMKQAFQPGRFEKEGVCIMDGAHNPAGMEALAETTEKYFPRFKPVMITGMLADKETEYMLETAFRISDRIIVTGAGSYRDMDSLAMAKKLESLGADVCVCESGREALDKALAMTGAGGDRDYVLITGSLYLVSNIRKHVTERRGRQHTGNF